MNKVNKIERLAVLVFAISVMQYYYEDYYQKIYTVKNYKEDQFKIVKATKKQEKKL